MSLSFIVSRIRAWNRYRASVRELSQLSDRQLSDIGLSRSTIDQAARSAAV